MGNPSAVMTAVTANPSLGVPPDSSKSDPVLVFVLVVVVELYYSSSIRFVNALFCCCRGIENKTSVLFVRNQVHKSK